MKYRLAALLCVALTFFAGSAQAALGEREIAFSEAEVQAALDKNGPLERRYGGLLVVALREPPRLRLGVPDGRVGITARVQVALFGNPQVPVDVRGHAGIRYDDQAKAFYLENPVAESVESVALPRESEPHARQAVSQLIAAYFRHRPVYVLRENGSPEEIAARWLLRAVRIEPGRVVATLSPL